jgi:SAM-dependent methyltransferase
MPRAPWNHNLHYHDLVLRSVPAGCKTALEVGCGTGLLARKLATRSERVIGIDLDRAALSHARSLADPQSRIEFVEADAMTYPFAPASFDFIAAVAALHHLPLRPALSRLGALLGPGGVLAVVGCFRSQTVADFAVDAVAVPTNWILRAMRGYSEPPVPTREPGETLREIRGACEVELPGAKIRRLLLFRYFLLWRKP